MRKLCYSLFAGLAFVGCASNALAFEAMLGGNFILHAQPNGRHLVMLAAGDTVDIDHCNHGWCAVTHGDHAGYLYMPRVLDGNVYGPRGGGGGGPAELVTGVVTAPVAAAGQVVDAGVSILR
ncbi:MAG TPA: hypothetical protein VIF34_13070 [Methylocystis sp.]|jgi:hypothetical protein